MKNLFTLFLVIGFLLLNPIAFSADSIPSQNIIITPEFLIQQAEQLKEMHENLEGITTSIVTTEWIDLQYQEAENPPFAGYPAASGNPVPDLYNFSLAKKIIAFLRDQDIHPDLESITLLGDALLIPASYYFYINNYNFNSSWIPSDLFYISPDYDFYPEFEVGRIPVNDSTEAQRYFQKVAAWKSNLSPDWFHNVRIFAGDPYDDGMLQAEVGVLEMIHKGYLTGMNVEKNFHSRGRDHADTLLARLADENTGIIYCSGHGSGYSFANSVGTTTVSEIEGLPFNERPPVVINSSCLNGGFDFEYMSLISGETGFGEALIRSEGGAVAYFGSTRVGHARNFHTFLESGQMVMADAVHLKRMTNYLIKAYAQGYNSFGGMRKKALEDYMALFSPADRLDSVTVMEFMLHGDPVFTMLSNPLGGSPAPMTITVSPEPDIPGNAQNPPCYYFTESYSPQITVEAASSSATCCYNLCALNLGNPVNLVCLDEGMSSGSPFTYTIDPGNSQTYVLSLEDEAQKEIRIYLSAEEIENFLPYVCTIYPIDTLPQPGSFDVSWSPSYDLDDGIAYYRLKEMHSPTVSTDSCNEMDRWINDGFRLSQQGWDLSSCFYSGNGDNLNYSLTTQVPVEVGNNDTLKFITRYNIEDGWDFAYAEASFDSAGFTILASFTGIQANWDTVAIPLVAYAGQEMVFRFRYVTDEYLIRPGIWIDNIEPVCWFSNITETDFLMDTVCQMQDHYNNTFYYQVQAIDSAGYAGPWSHLGSVAIKSKPQAIHEMADAGLSIRVWYQTTTRKLMVEVESDFPENAVLTICNMQGQALCQTDWKEIRAGLQTGSIPLAHLPRGLYLLLIETEGQKQTVKFIL